MAKNCFIYETLESVKTLKVGKEDGLMTLSGVFGVCGVRNNNKRVYEAGNYGKMVTEMKARIKAEGGIPGELEHPQTMNMTLENISHKITDINIDEKGVVTGTIALLNTPKGKIAQAIVEGGLPLFISSRATGNVDKNGSVMLEKIATYDLVGTPGFSQAVLKLNENQIAESINESLYFIYENDGNGDPEDEKIDENKINDMDLKSILERLETLENRIADLEEENESLREQLEDIENSTSRLDEDQLKQLANGIQKWIIEEYSPVVEKWITEDFINEHQSIDKDEIINRISEGIEKWITEEYSPIVEKWITEEYSPIVEQWAKTELAEGIQNWVIEEFSPEVEKWLNESYITKVKDVIVESKKDNLNSIDDVLNILESIEETKPVYRSKSLITENLNNLNEPAYIREMPDTARVKYNMASPEVKEAIARKAKLYNFVAEGAIERFWSGINFEEIKPSKSIYEGLGDVMDTREKQVRFALRSSRFRK